VLAWVLTAAAMLAGLAGLIMLLNQGRRRADRYRALRVRLAAAGFEAVGKAMMRRVGNVVVLARSDDTVDLRVPALRFGVEVYVRDPKQTIHGFIGEPAFDDVFYSRPSGGRWAFHGLSAPVRTHLLALARLGRVSVDDKGLELALHDPEGGFDEAVGRVLELAKHQLDLEQVVRTDPSDLVAVEALRALFDAEPERAVSVASEVHRSDPRWNAEQARLLRDVETLAGCIAAWPDETRLLDRLDGAQVVELLELLPDPLATLSAMRQASVLPPQVSPGIGRVAWRAVHQAVVDPGADAEVFQGVARVWPCAAPHLVAADLPRLAEVVVRLPAGHRQVLDRMAEVGGAEAVPHLRLVEGSALDDQLRGLARHHIDRLVSAHPERRGGVALADGSGGGLSVPEEAPQGAPEAVAEAPRARRERQGTAGS